jgi:hypothetical protein
MAARSRPIDEPAEATALDGYLSAKDPAWEQLARELDRLIMAAGPELWSRVSYGMVLYSLGTDKARWVVGIDVRATSVVVRFLWGVLLSDPAKVLRGGTSTLMNLDLASADDLDPALLTDLVRQAIARYPEFVASKAP